MKCPGRLVPTEALPDMLSQPILQFLSTSIADEDDERLRLDEVIAIQYSHDSTLHYTFIFAEDLSTS